MATPLTPFIDRWKNAGGAERANYQLFLTEFCDLLDVPHPNPATPDDSKNNYVFDRSITATNANGTTTTNFIDLYYRAHFVLETKQGIQKQDETAPTDVAPAKSKKLKKGHGIRDSKIWDDALLRAKSQAENYVRSIPDDNPPFLLVVDVGYSIETYSDFSGLGKTYTPFPSNLTHRFKLTDLADPAKGPDLFSRLQKIWLDPHSLNPARRTAKITRDIAAKLAELSKSLEKSGHDPELVAHFLMRILFTCFAEDVHLLSKDPKKRPFTDLLKSLQNRPEIVAPALQALWQDMDRGGFSSSIHEHILQFNGGLFADTQAIPLTGNQLESLIEAAEKDWSDVEPAIFGTLLERALHPTERHKLGAHYTPRAYVERLVLPTVIEPLREEWAAARTAAIALAKKNTPASTKKAVKTVGDFLKHLCSITVLDPACGSGNFLYVTLEHLKRLEGEIQDFLHTNFTNVQLPLEYTGLTVDPHQLRGIEINPRAAAITDLVLWIGYLQWHFRTHGQTMPQEPILKKFDNIETRDAVLAYDKKELARDENGKPITRWDGITFKRNPTTGEDVPNESARASVFAYTNPRKTDWPKTDYVVGNPPFIGIARIRDFLGEGYAEAIRETYPEVPESIDFVMYWWEKAAELVRRKTIKRFGFITTNSIKQTFSRRVVKRHLDSTPPLSLAFAIPDHPWVDSADGAAVRISMTVGVPDKALGLLQRIVSETEGPDDAADVTFLASEGSIQADLTIGAAVSDAVALKANHELSNRGVQLIGAGFMVTPAEATKLGLGKVRKMEKVVRLYRNGRDITDLPRDVLALDFFGLSLDEVRGQFPEAYQWILDRVKPERDQNKRASYRKNWWLHGEPRANFRPALEGLSRYIATVETAKHRLFVFLDSSILADNKLVLIAIEDAFYLGVLSSSVHTRWALAAGSTLEDRPVYVKTTCFDPFPFPDCTAKQKQRIRQLAEELDAHRKRQQAKYPGKAGLTLTDMYNVLEKLRAIDAGKLSPADFSPQDKAIHTKGLISILKQLHDDLDTAVFDAYGWPQNLTDDQLLEKLVALNHQRAIEEKRGIIKYLRPDFQNR